MLFLILWNLRLRVHPEGMLAMIYIVLYSISQFLIFFLRDNVVVVAGLKQAQVTALVVILLTSPVMIYLRLREQRSRRQEQPPRTEPRAEEIPT